MIIIRKNILLVFLALMTLLGFFLSQKMVLAEEPGVQQPTLVQPLETGKPQNPLSLMEEIKKEKLTPRVDETPLVLNTTQDKQEKNILDDKEDIQNISWLRSGLATIFVLSLITLIAYFLHNKQTNGGKIFGQNSHSIRVVQNLSLGMKKSITVLEWEGNRLLVGVSQQGMYLLTPQLLPLSNSTQSTPQVAVEKVSDAPVETSVKVEKKSKEKILAAIQSLKNSSSQKNNTAKEDMNTFEKMLAQQDSVEIKKTKISARKKTNGEFVTIQDLAQQHPHLSRLMHEMRQQQSMVTEMAS